MGTGNNNVQFRVEGFYRDNIAESGVRLVISRHVDKTVNGQLVREDTILRETKPVSAEAMRKLASRLRKKLGPAGCQDFFDVLPYVVGDSDKEQRECASKRLLDSKDVVPLVQMILKSPMRSWLDELPYDEQLLVLANFLK